MRTAKRSLLAFGVAAVIVAPPTPRARAQSRPSAIMATASADLRTWDGVVDRLIREGTLRVRATNDDLLLPGRLHERLDQYVDGVRVFGGDLVRQTENGVTISMFGTVYSDVAVGAAAAMTPEDARAVVAGVSDRQRCS